MSAAVRPTEGAPRAGYADLELEISGMTCASCANRIERKLNKLDGVTATVNYATEKAKVTYPDGVATDDLLATVEAAGYAAALPGPAARAGRRRRPPTTRPRRCASGWSSRPC